MNIITGLQANSELHIGNYFGAVMPIAHQQKTLKPDDELYTMVVDLHSYTLPIDHTTFYAQVLNNVRWYLAAGLDPARDGVSIFRQSRVPAHTELAWHLSCFSYFGELSRMTQFKDKSQKQESHGSTISVGLFTYPVLMAADILLYGAEYVPLGDDQKQHVELTRDVALRFNHKFETISPDGVFVIPHEWKSQLAFMGLDEGVRIRSLSNPEAKMSKSVSDPKGTILLSDDPAHAAKKVMSSTTDSLARIAWDWQNQPGITNLLQLAYIIGGTPKQDVITRWEGQSQYGDLKKHVAGLVEEFLTTIQTKAHSYTDQDIEDILAIGEQKARIKSEITLSRVRKALGLTR